MTVFLLAVIAGLLGVIAFLLKKSKNEMEPIDYYKIQKALMNDVEQTWIKPIVENHQKTVTAYNEVFFIYNKKIARLEKMFVTLGHGDVFDHLCKMEELSEENLAKGNSSEKTPLKLVINNQKGSEEPS